MDACCGSKPRFRLWRIAEALLFLVALAAFCLYTAGCQMPIAWKGVIGPRHWLEVFVENGDLDLLFMAMPDAACVENLVDYTQTTGYSILRDDGDCGKPYYRSYQRPVIIFLTPDWLYDRCFACHQPTHSLIVRLPLATTSLLIALFLLAVRVFAATRKFLRTAGFRCGECGYPLQGLPALRCPECGQV